MAAWQSPGLLATVHIKEVGTFARMEETWPPGAVCRGVLLGSVPGKGRKTGASCEGRDWSGNVCDQT